MFSSGRSTAQDWLDNWKPALLLLAIVLGLYALYPSVQLQPRQKIQNVTEIAYVGISGPVSGPMADVVDAFERQSAIDHAHDPSRPIYRVVSGQDATRNQAADPTRLMVSVAGGEPPDVLLFDNVAICEWAARGVFDELDPYIQSDRAANRKDFPDAVDYYPSSWRGVSYRNHVYGIPLTDDDRVLYYNKDLLIRAGLVDAKGNAKPPTTWEELRAYNRRLTERNPAGQITTLGFGPNFGDSWLYMYGFMNDAKFMSDDGKRCQLNSAPIREALQFMLDVYDDTGGYEKVEAFRSGFQTDALDPFIRGKLALKVEGAWYLRTLAQFGRDVNFGLGDPPRPASKAGEGPVTWSGGFALAIPRGARHKEAAWNFIRFVCSDRAYHLQMESDRESAEADGRLYLPEQYPKPRINQYALSQYVIGNPEVPKQFQTAMQAADDILPAAQVRPVTPVGQLLYNEQIHAMETALYHRLTPAQALADSQETVQKALDQILAPPTGTPIRSWTFFYVGYALLVLLIGYIVYSWDMHRRFRILRWFRVPTASSEAATGVGRRFHRHQWKEGILCCSPWLLGFLIFGGGPMLFSLLISFCQYDIINPARLIGFQNYTNMLGGDPRLLIALINTFYMALGVPLTMAVSLAMAMLLNQKVRGSAIWRTVFYIPAIVPLVAASMLWVWVLNPEGGLINLLLAKAGIQGPLWLQSSQWSKPGLILMGIWGCGGSMIIWLAGLKGIPQSLYEAAAIDGASHVQQFLNVTLPQLTPYILFNSIMGLIATFQMFGQAFIMTSGGPDNSTLFYVYHLFNNAFRFSQMGYASAMAWLLFAVVIGLTGIQLRLSRRWVHYGDQA